MVRQIGQVRFNSKEFTKIFFSTSILICLIYPQSVLSTHVMSINILIVFKFQGQTIFRASKMVLAQSSKLLDSIFNETCQCPLSSYVPVKNNFLKDLIKYLYQLYLRKKIEEQTTVLSILITMGLSKTDNINQMMTITKSTACLSYLERVSWILVSLLT